VQNVCVQFYELLHDFLAGEGKGLNIFRKGKEMVISEQLGDSNIRGYVRCYNIHTRTFFVKGKGEQARSDARHLRFRPSDLINSKRFENFN
jgi:hypothetical protein